MSIQVSVNNEGATHECCGELGVGHSNGFETEQYRYIEYIQYRKV